jgi:anaerobic magnesium-protoporphyrin IX monomethyl ester cyclase
MLNFLFIKPGDQKLLYGETSDFNLTALEPPFWPLLLATYLKKKGIEVRIIDLEVDHPNRLTFLLAHYMPSHVVICVSGHNPNASIMNMAGIDDLCHKIKYFSNPKILLHGLYPSSEPVRVLNKHPLVDKILMHEGFLALNHLLGFKRSDLITIDDIGEIDWSLIDINKYRAHNWHCFENITKRSPYGVTFTSFGCPHKCDFCCVNIMYSKVQLRDTLLVYNDIKHLYDQGVRNIKFMDELFTMSRKRVLELCLLLITSGMESLNIWAYARTDTLDDELVKFMKEAGINWLGIGYESGSQLILNSSDKKQSLTKAYKATEICKKYGMNVCGNFVFGLADDNYETMIETLKLAIELQPEWANFNTVFAFPGTGLCEKIKEEPWFHKPEKYEQYSQHGYHCTPIGTKYLTPKEVLEFRDEAFRQFYYNPNYLLMIESKFGKETREHIENSLIYYPKRKLYDE